MAWRRTLVALVVLAGLAAAAWWGWRTYLAPPPADQGGAAAGGFAVPVDAATVRRATVLRRIEAVGTLAANEEVTIRPETAGIVTEINFVEGQEVGGRAVLFRLDDVLLQAELAQSQASLALSEQNYNRAAELLERGSGTVRARDEALSALRFDQAALALAQARVDKMVIAAPFAGVLGLRNVSVGDYVAQGEAMVTLQDIDRLKVDFRIPELFLAEVSVGQELRVRVDALPGEDFAGAVFAIDPQVDVNGRALVVRATLENTDGRLRPGLFARVDVVLERRNDALLVPEAALLPSKDGQAVYRVVEGVAELVPVAIGLRQGGEVEVLSGLAEGDVVVIGGQLKLQPGTPVAVPEAAPAPADQSQQG